MSRMLAALAQQHGFLVAEPCQRCGKDNAEKHHEDYEKPLEVVWLCRRCHAHVHMKSDSNSLPNQTPNMPPPMIYWRQILDDLRDYGCSGYKVAQEIGVGWSTVQGWRKCKEDIGHGFGRALLRLHARYCGAALTIQRQYEAEAKK